MRKKSRIGLLMERLGLTRHKATKLKAAQDEASQKRRSRTPRKYRRSILRSSIRRHPKFMFASGSAVRFHFADVWDKLQVARGVNRQHTRGNTRPKMTL